MEPPEKPGRFSLLYEPLLRETPFGFKLLESAWESLNDSARLELLLHFSRTERYISDNLLESALRSECEAIRILAAACASVSEEINPELLARIRADEAAMVRAMAPTLAGNRFFDCEDTLFEMPQEQRIAVIGLSRYLYEDSFARLIREGIARAEKLSHAESSEQFDFDAAECVWEYINNPHNIKRTQEAPFDGLDEMSKGWGFQEIWRLTTDTPPDVHRAIAHKYPLMAFAGRRYAQGIDEKTVQKMSESALQALAYRQSPTLLRLLEERPSEFSEKVKLAASHSCLPWQVEKEAELWETPPIEKPAHEYIEELRQELSEKIDGLASRLELRIASKRGIFW